jgi:hypothetical protein
VFITTIPNWGKPLNIFDAFERISRMIKQEFGEIARQIEEEGGTADYTAPW